MLDYDNNRSTPRERAHLLRRFPGLGNQIAEAVGQMADYCHGEAKLRTWADIRPEFHNDPLPSRWVAWVCAKAATGDKWRFPLIPDEHNPRPGKDVKESDAPWAFESFAAIEKAAQDACDLLDKQLRKALLARNRVRPKSVRFVVGGDVYTMRDMMRANKDDPDLCDWLLVAMPGDRFPNGAGCECIEGCKA